MKARGDFSSQIGGEPKVDDMIPVTKDYPYIPSKAQESEHAKRRTQNAELAKGWLSYNNVEVHFEGLENLVKSNGGVVVANHNNTFDWYLISQQIGKLNGKNLWVLMAEYNNRTGWEGEFFRSEHALIMGNKGIFGQSEKEKEETKEALTHAIGHHLKNEDYLFIAPAGSLWLTYEKPQVMRSGAFHIAIENNKPIIPVFTTLKQTGPHDASNPEANKELTFYIGEEIWNNPDKTHEENVEEMMRKAFLWQKSIYEKTYGKELEYNCSPEINNLILDGAQARVVEKAMKSQGEAQVKPGQKSMDF